MLRVRHCAKGHVFLIGWGLVKFMMSVMIRENVLYIKSMLKYLHFIILAVMSCCDDSREARHVSASHKMSSLGQAGLEQSSEHKQRMLCTLLRTPWSSLYSYREWHFGAAAG